MGLPVSRPQSCAEAHLLQGCAGCQVLQSALLPCQRAVRQQLVGQLLEPAHVKLRATCRRCLGNLSVTTHSQKKPSQ